MSIGRNDDLAFLYGNAYEIAPLLLGCTLERTIDNEIIKVRIVEVEAYDESDVASHSYNGKTQRTAVMFDAAGSLYVYFTYGMHYCCNIVTGPAGYGAAVLIRAVEPIKGTRFMQEQRKGRSGVELTNGPAKLCQALGIDKTLNGHNLHRSPLRLINRVNDIESDQIVQTSRIGISKAQDKAWRFYIDSNPYVSKLAQNKIL